VSHVRRNDPDGVAPPAAGGYSHSVRVDLGDRSMVFVSGQLPLDRDGALVGAGDMAAQSRQVFENLKIILEAEGATFADVVKENVYATDLDGFIANKGIRKEFYRDTLPAATWVQVQRLYVPSLVVEIELTAVYKKK